jgi:hypothetical protein
MTIAPSTTRPLPPPPPKPGHITAPAIAAGEFRKSAGKRRVGHRIGIYGPGGIGKTTLASLAPGARFLDLERGTDDLAVQRIDPPGGDRWTWPILRAAIQTHSLWETSRTLVLDNGTTAEELCVEHVIGTVPTSESAARDATSIESYGYGKGLVYVYEEYLKLLQDLDAHVRAGRNVVMLLHDCIARVPNPESEDFIRYEPRLQSPPAGKASIRHRVREWCDHLLYVGYDVAVKKGKGNVAGKATGSGTRTIYCQEMPWYMAKSRTLRDPLPFQSETDDSLWRTLFPVVEEKPQ